MNKLEKATTKKALAKVEALGAEAFGKALARMIEEKSPSAWKAFVLQQWLLVFREAPPKGAGFYMLALKLKYHLAHEEAVAQGKKLPERFLRNHRAAMRLDLQGFDAELRRLLESKLRTDKPTNNEEEAMKKTAVIKKPAQKQAAKSKGPRKGETWWNIFNENATGKARRTDAEIAAEFAKRMGLSQKDVCEKDVVKSRGFFNFGALSPKLPKPKKPLGKCEGKEKK